MDTYNTLLSFNPSWTKARLYRDFIYIQAEQKPDFTGFYWSLDKRQRSCSLIRYCLVLDTEASLKFPYEVNRMDTHNIILSFTQAEQKSDFTGILLIPKLNKSQTLQGFILIPKLNKSQTLQGFIDH